MKPQIIIPVSLLALAFVLCSSAVNAAAKAQKKVRTEEKSFSIKGIISFTDKAADARENNRPSKPSRQKENEKNSLPPKEPGSKKAHSEEDGKHHHFHMHRAKKSRRCANLVCFFAKIFLVIMHICLLIYVYQSTLAHAAH
jgi:hypothetical protein